jgi:hypothetical protein
MPTRRIDEEPSYTEVCYDRDHEPPSHMVWRPGTYEHVCSSCGKTVRFVVSGGAMAPLNARELAESVHGSVQKAWDPGRWEDP